MRSIKSLALLAALALPVLGHAAFDKGGVLGIGAYGHGHL